MVERNGTECCGKTEKKGEHWTHVNIIQFAFFVVLTVFTPRGLDGHTTGGDIARIGRTHNWW